MFEKRRLTGLAERILKILPQKEAHFNMSKFPGISEEEIPDCKNIFVMAEHLSSAVCAAYCSHIIRKKYGHTPNILLKGEDGACALEILISLGVDKKTILRAVSIKEFYDYRNLGQTLLVLLPLHASLKIKHEALRWNFSLIGNACFFNVQEDFCEINKTENFFSDLYETVKVVEYNLRKGRFLPIDEELEAFKNAYYGEVTVHKADVFFLTGCYMSKYELQKKSLSSSSKKIAKQKLRLIRAFAPIVTKLI